MILQQSHGQRNCRQSEALKILKTKPFALLFPFFTTPLHIYALSRFLINAISCNYLGTKEGVRSAKEHPGAAVGITITAALFLMPGPRRLLFRNTLGRFQSEEAKFLRSEKNVKELNLSGDLMKKESSKLLERAALAEKDMKRGHKELMNTGGQIHRLAKSVYKVEAKAADLMDVLREIPGRDTLKLRAEVASMASLLRQQRGSLDKRIRKISDLGIPV